MFSKCWTWLHYWSLHLECAQYYLVLSNIRWLWNIENILPKKEYSLVIEDIPHSFNIQNIEYDS